MGKSPTSLLQYLSKKGTGKGEEGGGLERDRVLYDMCPYGKREQERGRGGL